MYNNLRAQTSLLKGKQQRTTFAAAFSGKAARVISC